MKQLVRNVNTLSRYRFSMTLHQMQFHTNVIRQLLTSTLALTPEESSRLDMNLVLYMLDTLEHITLHPGTDHFTWVKYPLTPREIIEIFADASHHKEIQ